MGQTVTQASGLLNDESIKRLQQKGLLINESFDENQLSGCCYEFRVGEIAYTYDYQNKTTRQVRSKSHIINPFETITIITMEKVNLDAQHFLLLFSKGSLFSMGLTPVSTAADPGFRGHLGITFSNLSMRPVQFKFGTGFVKGSFFRLESKAHNVYVGQHGDATMSWPYPSQYHVEPTDFQDMNADHWRFMPLPLQNAIGRLNSIDKYLTFMTLMFLLLVLLNILYFPFAHLIPGQWAGFFERIFNLTGAFASILGLFVAFILARKNR